MSLATPRADIAVVWVTFESGVTETLLGYLIETADDKAWAYDVHFEHYVAFTNVVKVEVTGPTQMAEVQS